MYEQVEKTKDNKSRAVANSVVQKKGQGVYGFVDNPRKDVRQSKRIEQARKEGAELNYQKGQLPSAAFKTVQRTVDTDVKEANDYIDTTVGYQGEILKQIPYYMETIKRADNSGDGAIMGVAGKMAEGVKKWASNYYNKSQAYLYEAQKANDFTNHNYTSYGVLGVNTDTEADMEVHSRGKGQYGQAGPWKSTAHEVKASTSENNEAVQKLVKGGLDQLKKREIQKDMNGNKFSELLITAHNDNEANYFPYTKGDVDKDGQPNMGLYNDVSNKLFQRMIQQYKNLGFAQNVTIALEHKGKKYAEVTYTP